ncbi:MAG: DUF599 family protein [Candidatus Heimdallarchaeota archaeon]
MLDELAFFSFIGCIILSIVFLFISLNKSYSRKGLRRKILSKWIDINLDENRAIAVQALRNILMVNTGFISALLVLAGLLIGLFQIAFTNTGQFFWGLIPGFTVGVAQLVLIIFTIAFSLFNFINSNRMIGNLTLMITSNPQDDEREINFVKLTFRSAQRSWMLGIRGLFYVVTVLTWIISPIILIVGTYLITVYIILVQDLAILDRNSKKKEKQE